jgi:hypothetical protein
VGFAVNKLGYFPSLLKYNAGAYSIDAGHRSTAMFGIKR